MSTYRTLSFRPETIESYENGDEEYQLHEHFSHSSRLHHPNVTTSFVDTMSFTSTNPRVNHEMYAPVHDPYFPMEYSTTPPPILRREMPFNDKKKEIQRPHPQHLPSEDSPQHINESTQNFDEIHYISEDTNARNNLKFDTPPLRTRANSRKSKKHSYRGYTQELVNIQSKESKQLESNSHNLDTTAFIDATLTQGDKDVFNIYTRHFLDDRLETLYQEFCAKSWFVKAKWLMLLWICIHSGTLFVISRTPVMVDGPNTLLTQSFQPSFRNEDPWIQLSYLILAIPFILYPIGWKTKILQDTWRWWVCLTIVSFNLSFQISLARSTRNALHQVTKQIENYRNIPMFCPDNNDIPGLLFQSVTLPKHQSNLYDQLTSVTRGTLVQAFNVFGALTSFIFSISVRLEFLNMLCIISSVLISYCIICQWFKFSIEPMAISTYIFAVTCVLVLSYSSDLTNRRSFVSHYLVQKQNDSMRSSLYKVQEALMNDAACDEETTAVETVMATPELSHLEVVRIPFSDLKLLQAIGRGAMGDVIKAKYYGTVVVVKRMRREAISEESIKNFRDEIEVMASLRHPNVVQFIGASWDNCSNICIVMEYLENGDMHHVFHSAIGKRFTWADPLLKMAIDVVQGMLYLHSLDSPVIHRDLKSVNIFCSATFGCKVGDFGLSRRYTRDIDALTTLVGTPFWLPPEIIRNQPYGPKADVYSFGIVLTELETRKTPYYDQQEVGLKLLKRIGYGNLRPTIPPTCLPERMRLMVDCLNDNPSERPTFAEVLSRLQHEVSDEVHQAAVEAALAVPHA